ncbi:MAG: hypothetical protein AAGB02_00210 [Pseudomonadota bacterium]
MKPLDVTTLDAAGVQKLFVAQDGTSPLQFQIAHGKTFGCFGVGSRAIFKHVQQHPTLSARSTQLQTQSLRATGNTNPVSHRDYTKPEHHSAHAWVEKNFRNIATRYDDPIGSYFAAAQPTAIICCWL